MRAPFLSSFLSSSLSTIRRALAASGALALTALLAACSSASASGASAQATATCPPTPNFTAVSGSVTAVNGSSVTVQPASGASVIVALANTTRYTVETSVPGASLAAGTPVLVLTDTNATTARSVRVLPANSANGNGGFGGGNGGFGNGGGPRGTPRPGANPACARRGSFGGGAGGGAGTDGTGAGFQGLRGTVDSASATSLTFDDAQGQTYSVAITATTTITKTATGQASDLTAGAKVMILAQKVNGQTVARTVTIQA